MTSVQTDEAAAPVAPQGAHFPGFDGLRALAALAVLFSHASSWTGLDSGDAASGAYMARLGQFGVAVFFVISGFLLYRPYAVAHLGGGRTPVTTDFYRRRFFRIFPAYWVALTAFLFVVQYAAVRSPFEVVQQYLLLQVYDSKTVISGLPQAWSLCVEVSFYLLLPGIAMVIGAVGRRATQHGGSRLRVELMAVGSLYMAGQLFRFAVLAGRPSLQSPTFLWLPGTIDWFAIGMAFAVMSAAQARGTRLPRMLSTVSRWPLVSWLFAAELYWILVQLDLPRGFVPPTAPQHMGKHLLLGAAAGLLVLPAVFDHGGRTAVARLLTSPPLRAVGVVSYSVFLWHVIWIRKAAEWLDRPRGSGDFWIVAMVGLALTLAWAAVAYRVIERPAIEMGRRRDRLVARARHGRPG